MKCLKVCVLDLRVRECHRLRGSHGISSLPVYNAGTRIPSPQSCPALLSLPSDAAGAQPGSIRRAVRSRVSWGRVSFSGVFAPPPADSRRSKVTVPPGWQWPAAGRGPLALSATSVWPRRSENPVSGTRLPRRRERGRHAHPSPPLLKQSPRGTRERAARPSLPGRWVPGPDGGRLLRDAPRPGLTFSRPVSSGLSLGEEIEATWGSATGQGRPLPRSLDAPA